MQEGIDDTNTLLKKYQERLSAPQRELINNFMETVGFEITPWQPTFSQSEMDCHTIHNIELLLTKWFCILQENILDILEDIPDRDTKAGELHAWFVAFDKLMTNHPRESAKDKCTFLRHLMTAVEHDLSFITACTHLVANCTFFNFRNNYPKLIRELKNLHTKSPDDATYRYSRAIETLIRTWANSQANLLLMHVAPCLTRQYRQYCPQKPIIQIEIEDDTPNAQPRLRRHHSFS